MSGEGVSGSVSEQHTPNSAYLCACVGSIFPVRSIAKSNSITEFEPTDLWYLIHDTTCHYGI